MAFEFGALPTLDQYDLSNIAMQFALRDSCPYLQTLGFIISTPSCEYDEPGKLFDLITSVLTYSPATLRTLTLELSLDCDDIADEVKYLTECMSGEWTKLKQAVRTAGLAELHLTFGYRWEWDSDVSGFRNYKPLASSINKALDDLLRMDDVKLLFDWPLYVLRPILDRLAECLPPQIR